MAGSAPKSNLDSSSGGERIAVVVARFNEPICTKLLEGAQEALTKHGVDPEAIDVHWVPGSFELPQAAQALADTGRFDAIICLGTVIQGETPHFDYVAGAAATGITQAALACKIPMSFGVITALDQKQAWDRAGGRVGNRGEEAALAALELARWKKTLA